MAMKHSLQNRFHVCRASAWSCALILLAIPASAATAQTLPSYATAPPPGRTMVEFVSSLDQASLVVIGKITALERLPDQSNYWDHGNFADWGRATVEVKETLKGNPSPQASFIVEMAENSVTSNGARMPNLRHVGDSGIWLVDSSNVIFRSYGRMDERNRDDVTRALRMLSSRKWSEPPHRLPRLGFVVTNGPPHPWKPGPPRFAPRGF